MLAIMVLVKALLSGQVISEPPLSVHLRICQGLLAQVVAQMLRLLSETLAVSQLVKCLRTCHRQALCATTRLDPSARTGRSTTGILSQLT